MIIRAGVYFFISSLLLSLVAVQPSMADEVYDAAIRAAEERIQRFDAALKSGNDARVKRAALELQRDPLAVQRVNQTRPNFFKERLNITLDTIKAKTKNLLRERIAKKYNVKPSEVTFFEATNPSANVKVGQDWDVTARVKGRDAPVKVVQQEISNAYHEVATGERPPVASSGISQAEQRAAMESYNKRAARTAHNQAVEVTNYKHPEGYGGAQSEGGKIITGPKGQKLRDSQQISEVIEHKSNTAAQTAVELEAQGKNVEAQGARMEQGRQFGKQYDKQIKPRVEAVGGKIPEHVKATSEIVKEVGEGKISPAQGKADLAKMGETPETAIRKGAELVEASQKLKDSPKDVIARAKAGKTPPDVFVENVKNKMALDRLKKGAEGKPTPAPGEAPKSTLAETRAKAEAAGLKKSPVLDKGKASVAPPEAAVATGEVPAGTPKGKSSFQEPTLGQKAAGVADDIAEAAKNADQAGAKAMGIGELGASAGTARKALNTVGGGVLGVVAVAGTAAEGYSVGHKVGEAGVAMKNAGREREKAEEARKRGDTASAEAHERRAEKYDDLAKQKAIEGGKQAGMGAGLLAVGSTATGGAVLGVAGAGAAGYLGTRAAIEGTETGQSFERAKAEGASLIMEGADALTARAQGRQTVSEAQRAALDGRQRAWLGKLESGEIKLKEDETVEDFLNAVKGQHNKGKVSSLQRLGDLGEFVETVPKKGAGDDNSIAGLQARASDPNLSLAERNLAGKKLLDELERIKQRKKAEEKKGEDGGKTTPEDPVSGGDKGDGGDGSGVAGDGTTDGGETAGADDGGTEGTGNDPVAPEGGDGDKTGGTQVAGGDSGGGEDDGGTADGEKTAGAEDGGAYGGDETESTAPENKNSGGGGRSLEEIFGEENRRAEGMFLGGGGNAKPPAPAKSDDGDSGNGGGGSAERTIEEILGDLPQPPPDDEPCLDCLRAAEGETLTAEGENGGTDPDAVEVAMNTNTAGNTMDGWDKGNADKGVDGGDITTTERSTAADSEHQNDMTDIGSQGAETEQNIGKGRDQHESAETAAAGEREEGAVLTNAAVGGLTSGVSAGVDAFGTTVGTAVGNEVSEGMGIAPPKSEDHPHGSDRSGGRSPSTGTGSDGSSGGGSGTTDSGGSSDGGAGITTTSSGGGGGSTSGLTAVGKECRRMTMRVAELGKVLQKQKKVENDPRFAEYKRLARRMLDLKCHEAGTYFPGGKMPPVVKKPPVPRRPRASVIPGTTYRPKPAKKKVVPRAKPKPKSGRVRTAADCQKYKDTAMAQKRRGFTQGYNSSMYMYKKCMSGGRIYGIPAGRPR